MQNLSDEELVGLLQKEHKGIFERFAKGMIETELLTRLSQGRKAIEAMEKLTGYAQRNDTPIIICSILSDYQQSKDKEGKSENIRDKGKNKIKIEAVEVK